MTKKVKVAAYCRVSTDKEDQSNSLISQRNYFAEYIDARDDWSLRKIYYDEGISGTQTKKRAGFTSMIEDAYHGKIDLILTKEVSRFARNTVDTLFYTRKLKEAGVGVIFTIDNIDTRDSDGELRLTIMASIAQEESRKTSERVKWGQRRRMEQGVVFGRDLLGYKVEHGRLTVNEEEAATVRAIFHKYTNEGKGTHVIARELSEEGMRPRRVKLWSNVVILRVLRNEKYVGDLCQKKTITPDYLTHARKNNTGEEEMVCLKDHHEPIIDRELWERTQKELEKRGGDRDGKEKYRNRYWCSGKLICGVCGKSYVSRCKCLKSGRRYLGWRCCSVSNHSVLNQNESGSSMDKTNDGGYQKEQQHREQGQKEQQHEEQQPKEQQPKEQQSKEQQQKGQQPKEQQPKEQQPREQQQKERQPRGCKNLQINNETLLTAVKFCISRIQGDPHTLEEEIMQEIKEIKAFSANKTNVQKLQREIDRIHSKRKKAIDLVLEGVITKEELKEQNLWYEEELDALNRKLRQAREETEICERQTEEMEEYRKVIDEIIHFQTGNESWCGEVLEKICIYPDHILDIRLKGIPFEFHLKFRTQGREDRFHTEIAEMSVRSV